MLNRALSVPAWRSLTIARTETLRAYREASRLTYEQNADVVQSYVWVAALSRRTCAACLALHGQEFPLAEPFGTHPNCRCTLVPRLRGEANPVEETGEDWLSRQPAATAEVVLGRTGAAAWQEGAVGLSDFVGERQSAGYGTTRFARSAREVVGAHG
jgi:SPP1 gp7 family putative phage head morphogenesis protein